MVGSGMTWVLGIRLWVLSHSSPKSQNPPFVRVSFFLNKELTLRLLELLTETLVR